KDKALATLARYATEFKPGMEAPWGLELIDAEVYLGRRDAAFAHVARMLEGGSDKWVGSVFDKLGGKGGKDGPVAWRLSKRRYPTQPTDKRLALVRGLLEGKASEQEAKDFLDVAKQQSREKTGEELRVLGEIALACKRPGDAEYFFRESATCRAAIRLGDL